MHFIAESLSPTDWSISIEMAEHGGDFDPTHDNTEDCFVPPCSVGMESAGVIFQIAWMSASNHSSFSSSPVLPPPKTA
jgi:hypothetical protein